MVVVGSDRSRTSRIFSTAPVKLGSCQPGRGFTAPCQPNVEAHVFGFRAAGTALPSDVSYETGQPAHWDPDEMKLL